MGNNSKVNWLGSIGLHEETQSILKDKSFWVTGAGTGYGASIAMALTAAGCTVIMSGRREIKLKEAVSQFGQLGMPIDNCHILPMDLCSPQSIEAACATAQELCPTLNGIINNAVHPSSSHKYPLLDSSFDAWSSIMTTNVTGAWYLTKTIFPHLVKNNFVRILNISSGAGWSSTTGHGIYNISKTALNSFSHSLAHESVKKYPGIDIQINTLVPSEAKTESNTTSTVSPNVIIPAALTLLGQPSSGPNGFFFNIMCKSRPFGNTPEYENRLKNIPLVLQQAQSSTPPKTPLMDKILSYDNGPDDRKILGLFAHGIIAGGDRVALYGDGRMFRYLMKHLRGVVKNISYILEDDSRKTGRSLYGIPVISPHELPKDVNACFMCFPKTLVLQQKAKQLQEVNSQLHIITPQQLIAANPDVLTSPKQYHTEPHIYPIELPEIKFEKNLDMILLELPPRYLPFMPFGVAHVHNMLRNRDIKMQTADLNILFYHRYHMRRLCDGEDRTLWFTPPEGKSKDPWVSYNTDNWKDEGILDFFKDDIEELYQALLSAAPKMLAISLNGNNSVIAHDLVARLKEKLPKMLILGGGYDCVNLPLAQKHLETCFDYLTIGEGEMTVPDLYEALAKGKRPSNTPGILSRYDTPDWTFEPGPIPHDLDALAPPDYEFSELRLYHTFQGHHSVPIATTRGCVWGRCNFCGETFRYRKRDPKLVVDEIEWHMRRGFKNFHTNESDMNGKPDYLLAIADEIVRRGLKPNIAGQMRINRKLDVDFFKRIQKAGIKDFNFGVDGWTDHTLKLQRKGYTFATAFQTLKNCKLAGSSARVNAVIGVPGETDEDVEETIRNMIACKDLIAWITTINKLKLIYNSEYFNNPEKYKIKFTQPMENFKDTAMRIPDSAWYSEDPYIDEHVREKRYKYIISQIAKNRIPIGGYTQVENRIKINQL